MTIPQLAAMIIIAVWMGFAAWIGYVEIRFHDMDRRLSRTETQSSLLNAAYQLEQKTK